MDYRKVMTKAIENKQHASTGGPVKRYSTEVSASKKPPPRQSGVQSEAVKAFLAKRKEEEENKARLAEKRKQDLLELRSIARHGRKANAMAKRTKDNNFMTNFAKTAELAAEEPYTSNVGSVQRRFAQKPLSPQWRQSPSMSSVVEQPSPSTNAQHRSSRPPQQQPKGAAASSALNFYDLLKVAAKKQHEPLDLPRIPKKLVSQVTVQEQGRMMTTDEKRRFQEEQARKRGKSLDEVHVPKRTRRKYVAGESEGEEDVDDNEHVVRRPAQARDAQPPSRGRPPAGFGLPQAAAKQETKTPARPAPLPSAQQSQFAAKKYLHLNERTRPPSSPTVNGNNLRPTFPKKASPARRSDDRVQRQPQKNESQSLRSAQNPIKRTANPITPRDSRDVKPPAKVPNKVSMPPIGSQRSSTSALKVSTSSTSSSVKQKQLASSGSSSSKNPVANGKLARTSAPSSSSRMSSSSSTMPPQKPRRLDDQLRLPSSASSSRPSASSSTRPVAMNARHQAETQPKVRSRPPPSAPPPPPAPRLKQQQLPVKASSSRQPLAGSRPQMSSPPSRGRAQMSSPPSRGRAQMSSPPSRGRLPPLTSRGNGRPLPTSQSRQFPPRDLEPRMFPPRDLERRPMQRPPLKRRIESDDDDEDEYDEEMDDFIDDGPLEDVNDLDYSEHIREIFGYDRNKYRYEPDDMCMESSFLQQMKEEAISAKMGILEDLEDIQREEEEMKRRTVRSKKPK